MKSFPFWEDRHGKFQVLLLFVKIVFLPKSSNGSEGNTHAHTHTDFSLQCLSLVASGRYRPGKDKPDPKTWKANFRCALNSLPDVCELHEHSRKRGNNAFRVYRMMPSTQPQRRRGDEDPSNITSSSSQLLATLLSVSGLRLFSRAEGRRARLRDAAEGPFSAWPPCSTRTLSHPTQKEDTPSEDSPDNCQAHSEPLVVLALLSPVVWWWRWLRLSSCRDVGGQTRRAGTQPRRL